LCISGAHIENAVRRANLKVLLTSELE
jgi:hypothetical protein